MKGYNWIARLQGVDPLSIPRLTVATDSLDRRKGSVVAVLVHTGNTLKEIYVSDSKPYQTMQYTEIDMDVWNAQKVPPDKVSSILSNMVGDVGVIYSDRFTRGWLSTVFPKARHMTLLDICELVSFQEAGYSLAMSGEVMNKLEDAVEYIHIHTLALPSIQFTRYAEVVVPSSQKPTYLKRIHQLTEVYKQCLNREL